MVMQRTAGRRSKPPVLEFARNVDATIAAALEGAGLVYRNGKWQPENTISAVFFMANALAALPVGTPVTVTTTGVVAATSGNVQGIVARASTAAGQSIPILRQGSMTLTGTFPANSILYISDKGVLSTTAADTSYFVGFTTTANNAFFLIGGSGGSGSVNTGSIKVDGTSISNGGGVLSAISTNSPAANTLVRTQDNGKISTDLLDAASVLSGMQVRYIVPENTTWLVEPEKCLVDTSWPLSVASNKEYKLTSPFGTQEAIAACYIKHPASGIWSKVDVINGTTGISYGIIANCPGDGYIYISTGQYLQTKTTGTTAPQPKTSTLATAEIVIALYCQKTDIVATRVVTEAGAYVDLPTISAKDVAELGSLSSGATSLTGTVPVSVSAPVTMAYWYAPSNGFVAVGKSAADSSSGALRAELPNSVFGLARVNENANIQTSSALVLKGQRYSMWRTGDSISFAFTPIDYDVTKVAVSGVTNGGSTNPSDGLRVGEVRNYSRYDTEIASNASFVNISEATQIDTTAYPEFAALVGVTGQYPIAAASLAGAQTIPYLYLGTYNGGTAPKALTENISFGSDTTAMANNSIMFVTDGDETVNVALVTVDDAENPALTAPALLLSVESSTDIAPLEATMSATTSTTAEPATSGILIRYEEKT